MWREQYLDEEDAPVTGLKGYAGMEYAYDPETGNKISEYYLDTDSTRFIPESLGYAGVHYLYDKDGEKTGSFYVDVKGKYLEVVPPAGFRPEKDEEGRTVAEQYYDDDGQAAADPEKGYACVRYTYDEAGNKAETAYFDLEDRPAEYKGIARSVRNYDECDERTEL